MLRGSCGPGSATGPLRATVSGTPPASGAWPRANGSRAVGWRGDWTVPDRRRLPRRLVRAIPGQGGGRRAGSGVGARLPGGARRAGLQRGVGWSGRREPAVHPDAPRRARPGPLARHHHAGRRRLVDLLRRGVPGPVPDLAERGDQEDRRRAGAGGPGQRPGRGRAGARRRPGPRADRRPAPGRRRAHRAGRHRPAAAAAGRPGAGAGRPALGAPGAGAGHHR